MPPARINYVPKTAAAGTLRWRPKKRHQRCKTTSQNPPVEQRNLPSNFVPEMVPRGAAIHVKHQAKLKRVRVMAERMDTAINQIINRRSGQLRAGTRTRLENLPKLNVENLPKLKENLVRTSITTPNSSRDKQGIAPP